MPTCFYCFGGFVSKHWQLRRLWGLCGPRGARTGSSWHHAAPLTAPHQPDQPVVRGGWAGGTCRKKTNRLEYKHVTGSYGHEKLLFSCKSRVQREETILQNKFDDSISSVFPANCEYPHHAETTQMHASVTLGNEALCWEQVSFLLQPLGTFIYGLKQEITLKMHTDAAAVHHTREKLNIEIFCRPCDE